MISVHEAREMVRNLCATLIPAGERIERVPLRDSLGRYLAESVLLSCDYPPFDKAMRDGFAVKSSDLASVPRVLRCMGEIRAGGPPTGSLKSGQAVRIMTGAPIPEGADAVVMVEDTDSREDGDVRVERSISPEANIARRGVEYRAGTPVLQVGQRIGIPELTVLASEGILNPVVYRRPRVAILATGDELVEAGCLPGPSQIRDSNSYSLWAQCVGEGCAVELLGIAPDEVSLLREMVHVGMEYDVLILSGGVSMGKYDLVKPVLNETGAKIHFDRIRLRPGKPTVCATLGKRFIFGLPGNPVSTFATFELFVRPVLRVLQGGSFQTLQTVRAILRRLIREKEGRTAMLPARVIQKETGLEVSPVPWKGSSDFLALCGANGFILVPARIQELEKGTTVDVILWRDIESQFVPCF